MNEIKVMAANASTTVDSYQQQNFKNHLRQTSHTQPSQKLQLNEQITILQTENQQTQHDDFVSSVRQFLPLHQTNASRSSLKSSNKLNSQVNGPSISSQPQDTQDMNGIQSMINAEGELILKNQKISVIPRTFQHMQFERIQVLDI